MSYVPLQLPANLKPLLRKFVSEEIERYLREAHDLLGMSIPGKDQRNSHFHVAVALLLLSTVGGISKTLYRPGRNHDAKKFKGVLKDWYPWSLDIPEGILPDRAGKVLYDVFRNPMVHCLGIDENDGSVIKLGLLRFEADQDASAHIADIACAQDRPTNKPSIVQNSEKTVLWLPSFYWGIRRMIEKMLKDEQIQEQGLKGLTQLKYE